MQMMIYNILINYNYTCDYRWYSEISGQYNVHNINFILGNWTHIICL